MDCDIDGDIDVEADAELDFEAEVDGDTDADIDCDIDGDIDVEGDSELDIEDDTAETKKVSDVFTFTQATVCIATKQTKNDQKPIRYLTIHFQDRYSALVYEDRVASIIAKLYYHSGTINHNHNKIL